MKCLWLAVGLMLLLGAGVEAIDFPDPEVGYVWINGREKAEESLSFKAISYKDLDLRIGSTFPVEIENGFLGLSYDLRNIEKLGPDVRYVATDTKLTIGGLLGCDFETGKLYYGVLGIMFKIVF